jgi:hypothetical protein
MTTVEFFDNLFMVIAFFGAGGLIGFMLGASQGNDGE